MIDSVTAQSYENWELCIADGSDADSKTRKDILACSQNDQRIKVTLLDENYGISGNTNKALELVTGEYTALFDHAVKASVEQMPDGISTKVNYELIDHPLVSIIIPTKDGKDVLDVCLRSIFEKSTYLNYEIVIADNGSTLPETKNYFTEIQKEHSNIHGFSITKDAGLFICK